MEKAETEWNQRFTVCCAVRVAVDIAQPFQNVHGLRVLLCFAQGSELNKGDLEVRLDISSAGLTVCELVQQLRSQALHSTPIARCGQGAQPFRGGRNVVDGQHAPLEFHGHRFVAEKRLHWIWRHREGGCVFN